MTIGQNNSAPAAYALTSTIKRLLDHLTEVDLYSAKDLESIMDTLDQLSRNVKNAPADTSPYLVTLLTNRLDLCKRSVANLCKRLERLGEPLPEVHEKCISILRSMSLANTRSKVRSIPGERYKVACEENRKILKLTPLPCSSLLPRLRVFEISYLESATSSRTART